MASRVITELGVYEIDFATKRLRLLIDDAESATYLPWLQARTIRRLGREPSYKYMFIWEDGSMPPTITATVVREEIGDSGAYVEED